MRYFEDFAVGERQVYGRYEVTSEEIKAFASRYDPQLFHLDEAAAKAGAMGVFCASGWHTAAMTMRMMVDHMFAQGESASMGSPGVDALRWLKPVVPGDVLRVESEVMSVRPSKSRPDMGMVEVAYRTLNQHDEVVYTFSGTGFYRRRPD